MDYLSSAVQATKELAEAAYSAFFGNTQYALAGTSNYNLQGVVEVENIRNSWLENACFHDGKKHPKKKIENIKKLPLQM